MQAAGLAGTLATSSIEQGSMLLLEEQPAVGRPMHSSYIPTLDGWRAIAIALVIGEHSYNMLMHNGSDAALFLVALFTHGGCGVDIFFGLSGFLIGTLLLREQEETGAICLRRFYIRRIFRILPPIALYMATLGTLSYLHVLPQIGRKEMLSVFFFFRNYIPGDWYTLHFWSLSVEEHFYAVIPLFLVLLPRKHAIRSVFLLIIVCIAVRGIEFWPDVSSSSPLRYHSENRLDGLLWGVLLALILRSETTRAWLLRRLTFRTTLALLLVTLLTLMRFPFPPVHRSIVAVAAPLLIAYTMLHPRAPVGRMLELPAVRWTGRISYSLYIWQMLFCVIGDRPLGRWQAFPLALICPFVCAAASYYFLEKPLIRMGHRLAGSPRSAIDNHLLKQAA